MALAKERGVNPKELAEEIAAKIKLPFIEEVSIAGPGFINFKLSREFFTQSLKVISSLGRLWGSNTSNVGHKVIIEYVNANAFKQLHIGHLMGATIGESLSRLIEFSGAEIKRESYGGDVGPHAAKAIYGIRKLDEELTPELIGKAYALGAKLYEEDEDAKAEIDALNKAIYLGEDKELMELHVKGREISMRAVSDILDILGTKLDRFIFESESTPYGVKIVEEGLEKGIFTKSDGAVIYEGEKKGLHTRVFITKQGTPTYEAKELGLETIKDAWWEHTQSIILTGKEQAEYFKVIKAALEDVRPEQGKKITHLCNGLMKLSEGKMSSRTGDVITAQSLIEDLVESVKEQSKDDATAQQVAVAAIKYSILKQQSGGDIVFDVTKSLSTEGDSGPYLQYALMRAKKILADSTKDDADAISPETPYALEKLLYRFPEVVARAQELYEPHHVTQYLTEIASEFNSFYAQEKILGGEYEGYKLLLVESVAMTLENGLWLLGIPVPERM
jgi:arginyl-tRNA synthetase